MGDDPHERLDPIEGLVHPDFRPDNEETAPMPLMNAEALKLVQQVSVRRCRSADGAPRRRASDHLR